MIRFLMAFLILLSTSQAVDTLSIPTDFNSVTTGTRANLSGNFTAVQTWGNKVRDTVAQVTGRMSGYTGSLVVSSLSNLRLKLDADNSETARLLVESGTGDSLFTVREDSTAKFYGPLSINSLTASQPIWTDANKKLVSNAPTGSGTTLVLQTSPTISAPTLTGTSSTGKIAASDTIRTSSGLEVQGNAFTSGTGTGWWLGTPGTFTYGLYTSGGNLLFRSGSTTPYLTVNSSGQLTFANAVTLSSTLNETGDLTVARGNTAANVVFNLQNTDNSNTASNALSAIQVGGASAGDPYERFTILGATDWSVGARNSDGDKFEICKAALLGSSVALSIDASLNVSIPSATASTACAFDASKNLVSVANTGTGNNVLATSPTLVTPNIGAATATSINFGGTTLSNYDEGTFTATATGMTASVTGTVQYVRVGKSVTLQIPDLVGTSNTTGLTITGLPAALRPTTTQPLPGNGVYNNSIEYDISSLTIQSSGTILVFYCATYPSAATTTFTNSGTKGVFGTTITYTLQ